MATSIRHCLSSSLKRGFFCGDSGMCCINITFLSSRTKRARATPPRRRRGTGREEFGFDWVRFEGVATGGGHRDQLGWARVCRGGEAGWKLGSVGKNTVLQGTTNRKLTRESRRGKADSRVWSSSLGCAWKTAAEHKETKETKRSRLKRGRNSAPVHPGGRVVARWSWHDVAGLKKP